MEHYAYLDTLSDFATAVQEEGALKVVDDLHRYYPLHYDDFVKAAYLYKRQGQIAALFKPTLKDE